MTEYEREKFYDLAKAMSDEEKVITLQAISEDEHFEQIVKIMIEAYKERT